MDARSFLPQYWLMSTPEPLCSPNSSSCMMKIGVFATVTADISSLPCKPTMNVSMKPSEVVMRFCSTTGSARRNTRL